MQTTDAVRGTIGEMLVLIEFDPQDAVVAARLIAAAAAGVVGVCDLAAIRRRPRSARRRMAIDRLLRMRLASVSVT